MPVYKAIPKPDIAKRPNQHEDPSLQMVDWVGYGILLVLLLWISFRLIGMPILKYPEFRHPIWFLIDGANLIFHEAGHVVFMFFGEIITAMGGSLLQIIIPIVCLVAFWIVEKNRFASAFCLWWLGTSLMDVGVYINDARNLSLELITGGTGKEVSGHDWQFILSKLGLLTWDHRLGGGAYLLGKSLIILGVVLMSYALYNKFVTWHNNKQRLTQLKFSKYGTSKK